jgi:hypothetical protein
MAGLSPALANEASLWLVIFLALLLAVSLAAVIMSPPQPPSPPAEHAGAEPDLPEPDHQPPAAPLPRRAPGRHRAAYPASDPARPPGTIRPPRASSGPPWEPAPKPGGPSPVRYGGRVINTRTGRTWRYPHSHPTQQSAVRCADAMQERIKRLGWEKATGGGQ